MTQLRPYKRVLLKLSGESIMGDQSFGIDQKICKDIALAIKKLREAEIDVGIVIGGGNIFRGFHLEEMGLERTPADHMGMLATIINGIALQQALQSVFCPTRVFSALHCPKVADSYNWQLAQHALSSGEVAIFVGGTGNPYFTTDTAAALRAGEIKADILLKATKVDGIYNKDPLKYKDAVKYASLSYDQALAENLKVMDATSVALCRANNMPIFVFNMAYFTKEKILDTLDKKQPGTIVKGE